MATNGYARGNGVSYDNHFWLQWQLATQEVGNNRSLINWQSYAHFNGSDNQLDNGYTNSSVGTLWSNGGRVKNFEGNYSTRDVGLASGSFWIGHNADGTQSVWLSGAVTFYGSGRSENGGTSWALPTIPRASQPSVNTWPNNTPDVNIGANPYIHMNSASGGFRHTVIVDFGSYNQTIATNVVSNCQWDTDAVKASLFAQIPNANDGWGTITVHTYNGGSYIGTKTCSIHLIIPSGTANPVFADFDYKDDNATTVAITGDNQYLIQGYSTLEVDIDDTDKATAQKSATMTKYNMAISSISQDVTYTTSDIAQDLGVLNVNSDTALVVKAIDSRNNQTSVSKTVKVLPYVIPQVTATARRVNNFETTTDIHIEGVISRLTVAGTDKNAVNNTNGVQYRYKKTTDVSWGSWTNRASSVSSGNVSTTDFQLSLDRNYAWNIEVKITDKLNTTTLALVVTVGIPIFRVSTYDNKVYNNEQPLMPSHIGQIIESVTLDTPTKVADVYGGTWVLWGVGRDVVTVDTSQTEFNTVEKTGGAKTHTLTESEMPSHRHQQGGLGYYYVGGSQENTIGGPGQVQPWDRSNISDANRFGRTSYTGGSSAHNNLQPYITAYRWKRTA